LHNLFLICQKYNYFAILSSKVIWIFNNFNLIAMKRFIIVCLLLSSTVSSFGQSKDYKRWSLTIDGGINYFDGDNNQNYNDVFPNSIAKLSWGLSTELTLTPFWGIGTEFFYLPVSAEDAAKKFNADVFHFTPYLSLNLLNLCNENNHSKWNIYATAGAGVAYYNSTLYKNGVEFDKVRDGWAAVFPVGGLIEYNISSLLAIGAKVQYRLQNKDNFEGTNLKEEAGGYNFKGVTNDNIALTALSLRWKIGAKNKNHIRNNETRITLGDVFTLANRANTKTDSLAQELDKLKLSLQPGPDDDGDGVPNSRDWEPNTPKGLYIDYNGRGIPEIKVIPETKEIYPKDIQYMRASTKDEDKDGVPDNRDKEPNSPKNQCVDFWGRSITQDKPCAFASVYFDFDKTNLDEEALIEIEKLVEKLSSDPTLLVEIRGYTDNVGSNKYNRRLSQERSNRVKAELVFTHNIDPQRIISNGMGKIPQPPTAYRMNRRCDFILSK